LKQHAGRRARHWLEDPFFRAGGGSQRLSAAAPTMGAATAAPTASMGAVPLGKTPHVPFPFPSSIPQPFTFAPQGLPPQPFPPTRGRVPSLDSYPPRRSGPRPRSYSPQRGGAFQGQRRRR
jgi:hypothetical protein